MPTVPSLRALLVLVVAAGLAGGLFAGLPASTAAEFGHQGFVRQSTTFWIHATGVSEDVLVCHEAVVDNHTGASGSDPLPFLTNAQSDPCHVDPSVMGNFRISGPPTPGTERLPVYLMPLMEAGRRLVAGEPITVTAFFELSAWPNVNPVMFDHFRPNVTLSVNGSIVAEAPSSGDDLDQQRIRDTLTNEGSVIVERDFDLGPAPAEFDEGPVVLEFVFVNSVSADRQDLDRFGGAITLLADKEHKGSLVLPFRDDPPAPEPEPEPEPEPTNTTATPSPSPTGTTPAGNNTSTPSPTPTTNDTAPATGDDRSLPAPGLVGLVGALAFVLATAVRRRDP